MKRKLYRLRTRKLARMVFRARWGFSQQETWNVDTAMCAWLEKRLEAYLEEASGKVVITAEKHAAVREMIGLARIYRESMDGRVWAELCALLNKWGPSLWW